MTTLKFYDDFEDKYDDKFEDDNLDKYDDIRFDKFDDDKSDDKCDDKLRRDKPVCECPPKKRLSAFPKVCF